MKLIFTLAFFLGITAQYTYGQTHDRKFADSAIVYKSFAMGGSTANLRVYSYVIDTLNTIVKKQLSNQYLDTLNILLGSVKPKRHYQQKIGPSYYAAFSKNEQLHRIAIINGFGIIDLTTNKEYSFRETSYIRVFNRLIENNFR